MAQKTTTKQETAKKTASETEAKVVAAVADNKTAAKEVAVEKEVKPEAKSAAEPAKAPAKRGRKPGQKNAVKAEKGELKPEVFIQFAGTEAVVADVTEKIKASYVEEGHRVSSIKSLQVYLKPEENAAYYVINQKTAGKVDLF
jgi:hypothetical protein